MYVVCVGRKPRKRQKTVEQQVSAAKPRKKRSDVGQKHKRPEAELQVKCVKWAEEQGLLVDGSPGGAAFRMGAHKARGCKPGRADLLIFEAGANGTHGLAIELKCGANKTSAAQDAWLARIAGKGWRVGVARTLPEFIQLVRLHLEEIE